MALDKEFVQQTRTLIEDTLKMYKSADSSPRVEQIWDCQNTGDFLCGFFVGEMIGSALSAFQINQKREPTPEEHIEIVEMVESYSKEIKEFFSKFNNQ